MILAKVHQADGKTVLAICDKDLLGKRYIEGNSQLDLTTEFYKGDPMDDRDALVEMMRHANMVMMVGKESVGLGLSAGIITEENIKKITGIPHAQVVFV